MPSLICPATRPATPTTAPQMTRLAERLTVDLHRAETRGLDAPEQLIVLANVVLSWIAGHSDEENRQDCIGMFLNVLREITQTAERDAAEPRRPS
jgi:hypothetical protein